MHTWQTKRTPLALTRRHSGQRERNYNLDFKNPNKKEELAHKSPKDLVKEIQEKEKIINDLLSEVAQYV